MNALIQFSYLQLLDLLSTWAFLVMGVQEGNPFVRAALGANPQHPVAGLLMVKVFAVVLGIYCWRARRNSLLARANMFFAALVVWNLTALIAATYQYNS